MRICIPTTDESGLEARAHNHFGSAPYFTVVDTETGSVEIVENLTAKRGHGTCRVLKEPGFPAVDAVACRSMGRHAVATMADEGLEVFVTRKRRVNEIIDAVNAGEISRFSSLDACGGRHTRHGHGHDHGHHGQKHGGNCHS